jgi:hypothetical protein
MSTEWHSVASGVCTGSVLTDFATKSPVGRGATMRDHPQRARVELNLLLNANAGESAANILMGRPG